MTYAEYKSQLKDNIVTLDELSQYKVVAHYDEKYQTKTSEGISETEIVESFGPVSEAIAAALILLGIEEVKPEVEIEEKKEEKAEAKKENKAVNYAKDTADDFKKNLKSEANSEVKSATRKASSNIVDGAASFISGLFKRK